MLRPNPPRGGALGPTRGRRLGGPASLFTTTPAAVALPLTIVGIVFAWWAWKRGAYFPAMFLPGAITLLVTLVLLLRFAPWSGKLAGAAAVAIWSLCGLGLWTLLSALWSPDPAIAVEDALRVFTYAVCFALGTWTCLLLGRRMELALAPVAGAGAIVALATLTALWTGSNTTEFLEPDATLQYPLGYRSAAAAFFMIAVFPMVTLAASRSVDWRLRGLLLGGAAVAIGLAVLAQSRGSVFAAVIAVAVVIAIHPSRLRLTLWFALAAVPAVLAFPWLLDLYQHDGGNTADSLPPLRTACSAIALTSALAMVCGSAVARNEGRLRVSAGASRAVGAILLGGVAIAAIVGVAALARAEGGPFGFVKRQVEGLTAGSPDLSGQQSRFGLDLRSERGDMWRVALDDFAERPVAGDGAGGFRFSYLLERDSPLQAEDPHSIELLMASELGLPGVVLFGAFLFAVTAGALRVRRLGPAAAALSAGGLGAGAYWLVHASVEWFWSYPAISAPALFALGAAVAPALLQPNASMGSRHRLGLAVAAGVLAVVMIPFLLSDRYTRNALESSDLERAYSDLERAADLNPINDGPLVAEAVIAEKAGDRQRALAALDRAERRVPEEWTLYYLEARILAPFDRAGARRALERALELNPRGGEILELANELGIPL